MPIATLLISQNTGLSEKETDRCMKKLCECNIALQMVVATADGEINAYSFRKESFAVPLLCFADEVIKSDVPPFFGCFDRKKPFV